MEETNIEFAESIIVSKKEYKKLVEAKKTLDTVVENEFVLIYKGNTYFNHTYEIYAKGEQEMVNTFKEIQDLLIKSASELEEIKKKWWYKKFKSL